MGINIYELRQKGQIHYFVSKITRDKRLERQDRQEVKIYRKTIWERVSGKQMERKKKKN